MLNYYRLKNHDIFLRVLQQCKSPFSISQTKITYIILTPELTLNILIFVIKELITFFIQVANRND